MLIYNHHGHRDNCGGTLPEFIYQTHQNSEIIAGNQNITVFNPFDGGGRGSSRLTFEHYIRSLLCVSVGWSFQELWRNCRDKELWVNQWLVNRKLLGVCRDVMGNITGWLSAQQSSTWCKSVCFLVGVVTKYLNLQQKLEVWLERLHLNTFW